MGWKRYIFIEEHQIIYIPLSKRWNLIPLSLVLSDLLPKNRERDKQ